MAIYWQNQIALLGRDVMFVDSGAILNAYKTGDASYSNFFQTTTDKLVTSTFVIAETVRRMMKSRPYEFRGPGGEQNAELAIHFMRTWLSDHRVQILHLPPEVFEDAQRMFESKRAVKCDLHDIISFVIVRGLEQTRIASPDGHFRVLGLLLYPASKRDAVWYNLPRGDA